MSRLTRRGERAAIAATVVCTVVAAALFVVAAWVFVPGGAR